VSIADPWAQSGSVGPIISPLAYSLGGILALSDGVR